MTDLLHGRNALVTGASRGIGAATAQRFAAEGANVAITARTLDKHATLPGSLHETAARCRALGAEVEVIVADLGNGDDRARIVPAALAALGSLDIVINNAAAAIYKPISDYGLKHRRLMTEINVQAPIDIAQAALPQMIDRGEGWIVNLSSGSKQHPEGPPYDLGGVRGVYGFYGASKAMLDRVTSAWGSELHGTGVRINTVEPKAAVLSEGADEIVGKMLRDDQIESMEAMVESILWLARCDADRTGNNEVSLDLLTEVGETVMALDGTAPHPGGHRR